MKGVRDNYERLAISEGKTKLQKLWDDNIKVCRKATV
jgi:hypothetical protein